MINIVESFQNKTKTQENNSKQFTVYALFQKVY